jgi:hypothetical protein
LTYTRFEETSYFFWAFWTPLDISIVMKGSKVDDLYFFQGSMVTSLVVVSSLDDLDSITSRLWHMELGGMAILSKGGGGLCFVIRKHEHLTFVSIVSLRSSAESSSVHVSIE